MPRLTVRRAGNSLAVLVPRDLVRDPGLRAGDDVLVKIEPFPRLAALAGSLRGRLTADEFTRLSNKGEDLD